MRKVKYFMKPFCCILLGVSLLQAQIMPTYAGGSPGEVQEDDVVSDRDGSASSNRTNGKKSNQQTSGADQKMGNEISGSNKIVIPPNINIGNVPVVAPFTVVTVTPGTPWGASDDSDFKKSTPNVTVHPNIHIKKEITGTPVQKKKKVKVYKYVQNGNNTVKKEEEVTLVSNPPTYKFEYDSSKNQFVTKEIYDFDLPTGWEGFSDGNPREIVKTPHTYKITTSVTPGTSYPDSWSRRHKPGVQRKNAAKADIAITASSVQASTSVKYGSASLNRYESNGTKGTKSLVKKNRPLITFKKNSDGTYDFSNSTANSYGYSDYDNSSSKLPLISPTMVKKNGLANSKRGYIFPTNSMQIHKMYTLWKIPGKYYYSVSFYGNRYYKQTLSWSEKTLFDQQLNGCHVTFTLESGSATINVGYTTDNYMSSRGFSYEVKDNGDDNPGNGGGGSWVITVNGGDNPPTSQDEQKYESILDNVDDDLVEQKNSEKNSYIKNSEIEIEENSNDRDGDGPKAWSITYGDSYQW